MKRTHYLEMPGGDSSGALVIWRDAYKESTGSYRQLFVMMAEAGLVIKGDEKRHSQLPHSWGWRWDSASGSGYANPAAALEAALRSKTTGNKA